MNGIANIKAMKKFNLKGAMKVAVTSVAIMVELGGSCFLKGSESAT